jgi:hypothetical protein
MGVTLWSEERLTRIAGAGGLERRRNGLYSRNGAKGGWHLERSLQGWLTLRRQVAIHDDREPLSHHADWAGPVKLVVRDGEAEQRVELFLGNAMTGEDDPILDEEASRGVERLTSALIERFSTLEGQTRFEGWQPPDAERLTSWLQLAGCETAIDKDHNVRFTLKRRGCDGQVRIERSEGRLRFQLGLGRWKHLGEAPAKAMRSLASRLNARSRLVRIAWLADGETASCDAQVDLSGLPVECDAGPHLESVWREMTRLAVGGLQLALRQLGLELPLLADAAHADVVTAVCQQ